MTASPSTMLKLPESLRLQELPALWASWQNTLRVEARQLHGSGGAASAVGLQVSAADLKDFDSGVLTLLLSAARLSRQEGVQMQVCDVPLKLQELARVYGVAELLWPELLSPAASAANQLA